MKMRAVCAAAALLVTPALAGGNGPEPGSEAARTATPAATEAPAGACVAELTSAVQRHYDGVEDLKARFEQQSQSAAFGAPGGEPMVAAGAVQFAKPGRMRWTYESPEPSVVVSDGSTLWIYDPVAAEVQILAVAQGFLSGTAIQFLLGEGRLDESFRVEAPDCDAERVRLLLTPREEASYRSLELLVDRDGRVHESVVVDLLGNRTQVRLLDVETNTAPPTGTFQFETPEGVRELRLDG